MIQIGPFWIITIASYVGVFLIFLTILLIKNRASKKFNILQYFIEEIISSNDKLSYPLKIAQYAFVIPSALPIFLVAFNYSVFGNFLFVESIIAAVLLLLSLLNIIMSYIPVRNVKPHSVVTTVHLTTTLLMSALTSFNGIYFFYLYQSQSTGGVYQLILGIVSIIFTILMILIIFNPKLKTWYLLESEVEEDGTIATKRPKIFPLAFSEWLSIFIAFISGLIFILELLKM